MKNIWIIMKKELWRVLKDPKLIIMLLLPGLIIYGMYSLMGNMLMDSTAEDRDATHIIASVDMPDEICALLELPAMNAEVRNSDSSEEEIVETKLTELRNLDSDILVVFEGDFSDLTAADANRQITIYMNSVSGKSSYALEKFMTAIQSYKDAILSIQGYDIASLLPEVEDVSDLNPAVQGFAMFVPFILMTFLFNGCMSVAPDAIAGEKERGTIATVLITPVKRNELALGKIFSLSILAAVSALSSFIGLMLSLPTMMGVESMSGLFSGSQYMLIFFVILSTVLFIIGVMSIISAFAKSVKEASMLLVPFMFLSMFVGLTTMMNGTAATSAALYLIPLYNTVQAMISIMTSEVIILNLVVTFISNIVYLGLSVFILTKMFNNEKIMFKK